MKSNYEKYADSLVADIKSRKLKGIDLYLAVEKACEKLSDRLNYSVWKLDYADDVINLFNIVVGVIKGAKITKKLDLGAKSWSTSGHMYVDAYNFDFELREFQTLDRNVLFLLKKHLKKDDCDTTRLTNHYDENGGARILFSRDYDNSRERFWGNFWK